jgi:hypothetical protein
MICTRSAEESCDTPGEVETSTDLKAPIFAIPKTIRQLILFFSHARALCYNRRLKEICVGADQTHHSNSVS